MANEYGLNYRAAPVAGVPVPKTQSQTQPQGALPPDLSVLSDALLAQQKFDSADALREQRYPARGWGNIGANAWNAFRAQRREKQGNEITAQAQEKALAAQQAQEDQIYQFTKQTLLANNYTEQEADPIARLAAKGKDIKPFLHEKQKRDMEVKTEVDEDGVEHSQYIDTGTMKTEGDPWISGRRTPEKPDKPQYTTISELDENGNTVERTVPVEEAVAAGARVTKPPAAETSDTLPFAKMPSENRIKLGLLANASKLHDAMSSVLVDENGQFLNATLMVPRGAGSIAAADGREGMMEALRVTSGANTPEEEIAREVDAMIPTWSDTDEMALAKLKRGRDKLASLYASVSEGFKGIPASLQVKGVGSTSGGGSATTATAPNLPTYNRAAYDAAVRSGQLKTGQHFIDDKGQERVVP